MAVPPLYFNPQSQSDRSQRYWECVPGIHSPIQAPHLLLSSLANLQQRIQAMSELNPPIRKINPVASLPPPSASSPILLSNDRATLSTLGGLISAPGPTPAPACPAPGSTPLFSPGLPSNSAKTSEDTPVTRNWGTTMATLWIPYECATRISFVSW
jgi:hypothetical protein